MEFHFQYNDIYGYTLYHRGLLQNQSLASWCQTFHHLLCRSCPRKHTCVTGNDQYNKNGNLVATKTETIIQ